MKKITMELKEKDVKQARRLQAILNLDSLAETVVYSMSLTLDIELLLLKSNDEDFVKIEKKHEQN